MPSSSRTSVAVNTAALVHVRVLTGLSKSDLARAAGISAPYVSRLESGSSTRVSPAVYRRLLDALRIADYRVLLAASEVETETEVAA